MPKRSKAEERLHGILVSTLPRVATQGITESWDKAADSLVKALAVFDLKIVPDEALARQPAPATKVAPKPKSKPDAASVVKATAFAAQEARRAAEPKLPPCPACGGQATYNGNYFCVENGCGWALCDLEEVGTPAEWEWFRDAYVALMTQRGQVPEAKVVAEATLRADAEFWAMGPTEAEVAGALEHLLAAAE